MLQIALIAIVALTFSILVTPLARRAALRVGVVAVPRTRDLHVAPVPLLGGAAIVAAAALLAPRSDVVHDRDRQDRRTSSSTGGHLVVGDGA